MNSQTNKNFESKNKYNSIIKPENENYWMNEVSNEEVNNLSL